MWGQHLLLSDVEELCVSNCCVHFIGNNNPGQMQLLDVECRCTEALFVFHSTLLFLICF